MEKLECKKCGKILEKKGRDKKVRTNRKFCDEKCRTRFNAYNRHLEKKDDLAYKLYNSKKSKAWYKKNKKRHIERVKKSQCLKKDN